MMKQPEPREVHGHAVLVGGFDDLVVTDGAAGLGDIFYTAFLCSFNVVAEGEEGVGA